MGGQNLTPPRIMHQRLCAGGGSSNRRPYRDQRIPTSWAAPSRARLACGGTCAGPESGTTVGGMKRPVVVWLQLQECTGCIESTLRSGDTDIADMILNLVSLEYNEAIMAAAGHQSEEALHKANEEPHLLVVNGSIASSSVGVGGGTLTGTGTVGNVSLTGGRVSPGDSPGTLTSTAMTWHEAGIYLWEISDFTGTYGASPGWDKLDVTPESWGVGDVFALNHTLAIPEDAPPGTYHINAGWYSPVTGNRLLTGDGDDHVFLGEVKIRE